MALELRDLARLGAQARILELQNEMDAIRRAFPDIGGARREREQSVQKRNGAVTPTRRRKWKMSAAQKKAVSARMRRYWAERREAKSSAAHK